jgi:hypothetical protein
MLSNTQSIILTGLMAAGLFIFGILGVLENFIVLTLMTLVFITIVFNLFYVHFVHKKKEERRFGKTQHFSNH